MLNLIQCSYVSVSNEDGPNSVAERITDVIENRRSSYFHKFLYQQVNDGQYTHSEGAAAESAEQEEDEADPKTLGDERGVDEM
ncbi:hypothetical protein V9T40_014678 [Parthenolecanium corni]|uniref:Uncharacterized protein n=1 Tax=Parthenolecanium corni TaxID=536013 RepID=A0AAN9TGZ6_9HEMI